MPLEALERVPPRMSITNVETGQSLTAQFNPEEVDEVLAANYTELDVQGMSHKPMHYKNTENFAITLELVFDSASARDLVLDDPNNMGNGSFGNKAAMIDAVRNYLYSFCYPMKSEAGDIIGSSPPRAMLSWPGLYGLVCRITRIAVKQKRFSLFTGQSTLFSAKIDFKEARVVRLTSGEAFNLGTVRGEG